MVRTVQCVLLVGGPRWSDVLAERLRAEGITAERLTPGTGAEAGRWAVESPALVVVDGDWQGGAALELLQRWRSGGLQAPVILLASQGSASLMDRALQAGVTFVLTKPVDLELFLGAVLRLLHHRGSKRWPGPLRIA